MADDGTGRHKLCHKGVIAASKVLALTALKCIENPELIEKAKAAYHKDCPEGYICPTAPDFMPDLGQY